MTNSDDFCQFIQNFLIYEFIKLAMTNFILLSIFLYSTFSIPKPCLSDKKPSQSSSKLIIVDAITACQPQKRSLTKISPFSFYNKHGQTILNATFELTETVKAPLEIKVEGERCNIQRTQCTSIPGINYDRFCSVFGDSYYGKTYFGKAEPPIKNCPIKKVFKITFLYL